MTPVPGGVGPLTGNEFLKILIKLINFLINNYFEIKIDKKLTVKLTFYSSFHTVAMLISNTVDSAIRFKNEN